MRLWGLPDPEKRKRRGRADGGRESGKGHAFFPPDSRHQKILETAQTDRYYHIRPQRAENKRLLGTGAWWASFPDPVVWPSPGERGFKLLDLSGHLFIQVCFMDMGRSCFWCFSTFSSLWRLCGGSRCGFRRLWVTAPWWVGMARGKLWQLEVLQWLPGLGSHCLLGLHCGCSLLTPTTWSLKVT